jgi:MraZ protein
LFRGDIPLNLDVKGRLAIPTRYRDRLTDACGGSLVFTISLTERCLTAYPFPEWKRIEDHLQNLPALDHKAQAISHLLIGHAAECEMDGQGRVLVPPALREWAGLDKRVRMVGQVKKFELWDEGAWVARREELLGQVGELLREPSDALRHLVL